MVENDPRRDIALPGMHERKAGGHYAMRVSGGSDSSPAHPSTRPLRDPSGVPRDGADPWSHVTRAGLVPRPGMRGDATNHTAAGGVLGVGALTVAVVVAVWWGSGAAPFHALAYTVVGLPTLVVLVVVLARGPARASQRSGRRVRAPRPRRGGERRAGRSARALPVRARGGQSGAWTPLVALAAVGVVLEIVGLAHGGRSAAYPTLSDVVDEVVRFRAARAALLALWGGAGLAVVHCWLTRPAAGRRALRGVSPPASRHPPEDQVRS